MIDQFMSQRYLAFFKPTEKFFEVIGGLPWRWKHFHDIGAGTGHLTRVMREKGFTVSAIDKYPTENAEVPDIEIRDVENSYIMMKELDCLIFARPCHSGFVGRVTREYLETGDVLYVSKPDNVCVDLDGFHIDRLAEGVGEDGEELWRVMGFDGLQQPVFQYRTPEERCAPDNRAGWIAPDGTFYGCLHDADHDAIAMEVLGTTVGRIEDQGFIRAYGDYGDGNLWVFGTGRWGFEKKEHKLTMAQARTLRRKGYKISNRHHYLGPLVDPNIGL